MPHWPLLIFAFVILIYLIMSVITFVIYRKDKRAAENKKLRISEKKLHMFALLGGWPGALIAEKRLRHKNRKWRFNWITRLIAVFQLLLWGTIIYLAWFIQSGSS